MLKTEIPYATAFEYMEYLDAYEALKEQAEEDARLAAQAKAAAEQAKNRMK